MARSNVTNEGLHHRIAVLIKEKDDLRIEYEKNVSELKKEINMLRKEINDYKKRETITTTDEQMLKFCLEEKAKNKNLAVIAKTVNQTFYTSYVIEDIERMIGNINDLSIKYQEYYYELVEKFHKLRKLDDRIEKDNITQNLNYLYDKASLLMEGLNLNNDTDKKDYKEAIVIMKGLLDTKGKYNKEMNSDTIQENELLSKIANGLTKTINGRTLAEDLEELDMSGITVC
jgi:hypothetical protein